MSVGGPQKYCLPENEVDPNNITPEYSYNQNFTAQYNIGEPKVVHRSTFNANVKQDPREENDIHKFFSKIFRIFYDSNFMILRFLYSYSHHFVSRLLIQSAQDFFKAPAILSVTEFLFTFLLYF